MKNDNKLRSMFGDAVLDDPNFTFSSDQLTKLGFVQAKGYENVFHAWGKGHEGNVKWTLGGGNGTFGTVEIITNSQMGLVTDPKLMGTYNYGSSASDHTKLDVAPYLRFGNTPNDPTSVGQRVGRLFYGAYAKAKAVF